MQTFDHTIYVSRKPLASFKESSAWFFSLTHRATQKRFRALVFVALRKFFLPQAAKKLRLSSTPIAQVDSPLDKFVPFSPSHVVAYLDFVSFYIRVLAKIIDDSRRSHCDTPTTLSRGCQLLDKIVRLYDLAFIVYKKILSTTQRGHYKSSLRFLIIHIFDPHYLCVPSLHVAIVVAVFLFCRKMFRDSDECLCEVRTGALKIIESVLYIKQHSVNCVAASLYLLTSTRVAGDFPPSEVRDLLGDLFKYDCPDIQEHDKISIREYIFSLYSRFLSEYNAIPTESFTDEERWAQPLLCFLNDKINPKHH